jgi:hypothetical protein
VLKNTLGILVAGGIATSSICTRKINKAGTNNMKCRITI